MAEIEKFYPKFSKKVRVLPLPVDYMTRVASPTSKRDPEDHDSIRILTFGHARNKAVDRLLHQMRDDDRIRLTTICPPRTWEELWEGLASELGVRGRVTVVSDLTDAELASQYQGADIFAMLSGYEGYGIPVAEALAIGTPTIISNLAVLQDTSRGMAVTVKDETGDSLAEAIEDAISLPASHWQDAARKFQSWTWQAWVREMLEPS